MTVRQSFAPFLAELNTALEQSLARQGQAAARGNLEEMEIELERQKNLVQARHQIEALQEMWPGLVGPPAKAGLLEAETPAEPLVTLSASQGKSPRRWQLREFWTAFLEQARKQGAPGAGRRVTERCYLDVPSRMKGLAHYAYVIHLHDSQVCLYIDSGDGRANKRAFDQLHKARQAIETAFGGPLEWQRLDHRRACRIELNMPGGGLHDRERWPEIQGRMMEAMVRLDSALQPHIGRLAAR